MSVQLTVSARNTELKPAALRRTDQVPCEVYGVVDNASVQCEHNVLFKAYQKAGESTVVELDVAGKTVPVLFHELQFDPLTDKITHVDFYALDMNKPTSAKVPVHFVGVAEAEKTLGGVFIAAHDHVTVTCLPANLPHHLECSKDSLVEFGMSLHVGDIIVPEGVEIAEEDEVVIASVQKPRRAEVVETTEEGEEGAEGEGAEGAEGAEGEAAEGGEGGDSSDS